MSAHSLASPPPATSRVLRLALALSVATIAGCVGLVLTLAAVLGLTLAPSQPTSEEAYGVSALARAEIPPTYLRLYQRAALRYGLDWAILAGIGKLECDHGRDPDQSCTKQGDVNSAGAGGPAQFLASTWSEYGVDVHGRGRPDRWDPADAIYAMANYLHASGAPKNYRKAIYAYNHAWWYVDEVEHWASLYRGPPQASTDSVDGSTVSLAYGSTLGVDGSTVGLANGSTVNWPGVGPIQLIAGTRAALSAGQGHVALVPTQAPSVVQAMIVAGNELQELPYGPAGHPDPRGAENEDCSSTVNFVLYRSGVRPIDEIVRENPLAQDYVHWGQPGPGRWVTIYATTTPTDHVFMVIAGLRLDTSHNGTDVGPNRDEDGPRWRILDHIPTWARWSVRHPPGL
jgi:hypothetical protein